MIQTNLRCNFRRSTSLFPFADKQERNLYKGINNFFIQVIYIFFTNLINKTNELHITLDLLFLMFYYKSFL